MTVVRGQIYQFNLNPEIFFSIQRIYSVNQILIMNVDTHAQTYFTQAKLLSTCTLMPYLPENRIHNGSNPVVGKSGNKRAFGLTTPFTSSSVHAHSTIQRLKGFAPTYLQGKLHHATVVSKAELINPLILGGRVGGTGRVIQAYFDQG